MVMTIQADSVSHLTAIESLQTTVSSHQNTIIALQTSNIAQQTTIAALQSSAATQSTTIVALQTYDLAQQSTISAQSSSIAVLQSDATSVCSRPLCGNGTTPSNGMCVPDCNTLRRRGIGCEPYCDDAPVQSSDTGNSSITSVIGGIVVGMILAFTVAFVVIRHVARKQNNASQGEAFTHQAPISTMYMNPLHQGANAQLDYEEPVALNSDYIDTMGTESGVVLDDERYVAPASLRLGVGNESVYKVFRSGSAGDDQ